MAHNIYSFIKIEKRQTKRGIYAAAFGIVSLICMAVLTIASFIRKVIFRQQLEASVI